jgi:holliday junction DNA helicase RuvB
MTDNIKEVLELDEDKYARAWRPKLISDFIGQKKLCSNLNVFIKASQERNKALDHVLLAGPPGLGKTTLAHIIANELDVNLKITSGPLITKPGDLAALLTNLEDKDVLFIDEIHRLNSAVEEVLYPAMEDYVLDLIIGEGPAARSVRIDLSPFTLIGATTRLGLLSTPLRERFGIPLSLDFYPTDELEKVIKRSAKAMKININDEGAKEIACRSRGTPRIAGRLLRRVSDFALVGNNEIIDSTVASKALKELQVDDSGLNALDHRYLECIAKNYFGGPVGIESISATLGETRDGLEDVVEPYLIQSGFINRTQRGRMLTPLAFKHLDIILQPKNDERR